MSDKPILRKKAKLIEIAHSIKPFQSFADLGGCWGVNGGYTFHARKVCGGDFRRAVIVDQRITDLTRERARGLEGVELFTGLLGSPESRAAVGKVDALIMYDILLHQVAPDWDQFITNWLPHTDMLIVYNQNWLKSAKTVRFVDEGLKWFKENVYYTNEENLERWFSQHDVFDHEQNKKKRDVHNFWQWGITAGDLIQHVTRHGFDLHFMSNYGPFADEKPWIVVDGFVFIRSQFRS